MAKKFRFGMQAVLLQREYLQEQAQRALAHALAILHSRQEEARQIEEEIAEQRQKRPRQGSPERIVQAIQYIATLEQGLVQQKTRIHQAEQGVEHARQALVECSRNTKAIEILRDKQKEAFHKEVITQETKRLDDFAGQAYSRTEPHV